MDFKYRADIDGMRTLAVMLVLIFHFKLLPLGKGGFMGVDIFFVISGFLITSILLKQFSNDTFNFKNFYYRRVKRLAPALIAVLALTLIYGYFTLLPSELEELSSQIIASQFYFSNFYYWQNLNYFGLQADTTILLHTWSLAVEEQFYIIYPVILLLLYKFFNRYLWQIITLGIIASFFLNIYFVETKPELTFYLLPTRAWELLMGAILVFIIPSFKNNSLVLHNTFGIIGLLLIIIGVLQYGTSSVFPGVFALYPVIGSSLLILSGSNSNTLTGKLFSNKWMVYLGQLSYSLYLVHWPVNVYAIDTLGTSYTLEIRWLFFFLTILTAMGIYHTIEKPLRKNVLSVKQIPIIVYYLTSLTASALIFAVIQYSEGLPNRIDEKSLYYAKFMTDDPPERYSKCAYGKESKYKHFEDLCVIGKSKKEPSWIIIGDSHALAISPAFDLFLQQIDESAYFAFKHSCPPLLGIDIFKSLGTCKDFNDKISNLLSSDNNLENIILISTWIYPETASLTINTNTRLEINDSKKLFISSMKMTIDSYSKNGLKVFIWEPVPIAKGYIPKVLAKSSNINDSVLSLQTNLSSHVNRFSYVYEALKDNQESISGIFSASKSICKDGPCSVLIDDIPVYKDNAHVSYSSRSFWSEELIKQYHVQITESNKN